jgi:phage FluMu gp28-like protein
LVKPLPPEQDLGRWLATESGFIEGLCRYDDKPIVLEPFQRAFLENRSRFRWANKSRQVGLSFLIALEALARCHLRDGYTCITVSYNFDESRDKIRVAREVFESIPLEYRKRLVVDAKTELAFESPRRKGKVSRIISHPSRAPRGKTGDVVLDELAHYQNDREVYRGSTALILRSNGQLTGCSTPLGKRGLFWEIAAQELRPYPHHSRMFVPWWLCKFFCTNTKEAAKLAPFLSTQEAVELFGRDEIREQFESLPLEDFEQEFCGKFLSESLAFFPYDLIVPCTLHEVELADDFESLPKPKGRLVAGFDVGRTHDRSELAVFEEIEGRFLCRLMKTYADISFAEQESELRRLLNTLPIARLSIDRTGIGMNLAENLCRDFPNVTGEAFSNESKERWCTDFKQLLQRRNVELPKQRDLVSQIHSIKRRILQSGKVNFDAEKTMRGGHADRFWATVLACQKERTGVPPRKQGQVSIRIFG